MSLTDRCQQCAVTISLALSLVLTSCALNFDASTLGVETTMASPAGEPATGQRFSINKKAVYMAWGAVSLSQPSLHDVLASQVTGSAKVADLRIRVRSRWSDVLITVLTGGMFVPRSVTFEGVVVQN